jgi:hypothetical protein
MRWAGHVARVGDRRGVYSVLVGSPAGKRPLGRPRHWCDYNMKMNFFFKKWDGDIWTGLIWLSICTVGWLLWMRQWTFGFREMRGISWIVQELVASQEGLFSMGLESEIRSTCKAHAPYYIVLCGLTGLSRTIFRGGEVIESKTCVLIFSITSVWNIFHCKKNWPRYYRDIVPWMHIGGLHVKYRLFLLDFEYAWIFSTYFREILKCQISWKSVQWDPSCSMRTDGRTDRHDDADSLFSQVCERV